MAVLFNKTIMELDACVNEYLVYLAHIQQSVTLTVREKIDAFNVAEAVADEVNAVSAKILSMRVNDFNQDDAYEFIDRNFQPPLRKMKNEMSFYDRKLKINEKLYFSVKEAIDVLVEGVRGDLRLRRDKINRLLAYQRLFSDEDEKATEKEIRAGLDEIMRKNEQEFQEVRFKAFKEMVRGVNHLNEDYFYRTNDHVIRTYLAAFRIMSTFDEQATGAFFVLEKGKDFRVRVKDGSLTIDYSVSTKTVGESATLTVLGFIEHDGSKVDFFVEETFSCSLMNSYLNAFNLTPVIRTCDACYLRHYAAAEPDESGEKAAKKHVDDFLSGRIG